MKTGEYLFLHAAIKKPEIITLENVRFFNDEIALNVFEYMHAVRFAKLPMTENNVISMCQKSTRRIKEYDINLIKELFSDTGHAILTPETHLSEHFIKTTRTDAAVYFSTPRTMAELKLYIARLHDRLNKTAFNSDVIELQTAIQEIENNSDPVIPCYELQSKDLRRAFGDRIYAAPIGITGTPGSGKTTVYFMIAADLLRQGLNGFHIGMEDSRFVSAAKIAGTLTGFNKDDILHKQKTASAKIGDVGKFYIADIPRSPQEIEELIRARLCTDDIHFLSIDFVQCVENMRGMDEKQTITDLMRRIRKICIEERKPFFLINQTTAERARDVMESKKRLTAGTEQGSGSIFQFIRFAYYLTPVGQEGTSLEVEIYCGKGTVHFVQRFSMRFCGATGRCISVYETAKE